MSTPRLRWLIAIVMLVSLATGGVLTWVVFVRPLGLGGGGDAEAGRPPASFSISGDLAEPFFPGGSAPLNLVISNPLGTDLTVSDVVVEVDAVDAPNSTDLLPCTVDDFAVEQLSAHDDLVVEAGASVSLLDLGVASEHLPQVLMLDTSSNQDGCKGASFSLAYSAVGRVAE